MLDRVDRVSQFLVVARLLLTFVIVYLLLVGSVLSAWVQIFLFFLHGVVSTLIARSSCYFHWRALLVLELANLEGVRELDVLP